MTNRLVCLLKVKTITLRKWGRFIKKLFHLAATPETSILFFRPNSYVYPCTARLTHIDLNPD